MEKHHPRTATQSEGDAGKKKCVTGESTTSVKCLKQPGDHESTDQGTEARRFRESLSPKEKATSD